MEGFGMLFRFKKCLPGRPCRNAVADPGFPRGMRELRVGGRGEGRHQSIVTKIYCRKLHENEENWTGGSRIQY